MSCHQAAIERRAAGKSPWEYRLNFRSLLRDLQDDLSDENAVKTGKEMSKVLRASTWLADDQKKSGPGDSEVAMVAEEFEDIEDVDHFEAVLDQMYDLADADRAWIGRD